MTLFLKYNELIEVTSQRSSEKGSHSNQFRCDNICQSTLMTSLVYTIALSEAKVPFTGAFVHTSLWKCRRSIQREEEARFLNKDVRYVLDYEIVCRARKIENTAASFGDDQGFVHWSPEECGYILVSLLIYQISRARNHAHYMNY